jgi:hypothetical protein
VRECELVGVAGGVMAPLLCILSESGDARVEERMRVGEFGGVEMVPRFEGLECLRSGIASVYPSLPSVLMLICI